MQKTTHAFGLAQETTAVHEVTAERSEHAFGLAMDCVATCELLEAYVDNELPQNKRLAVAEHLAQCKNCSAEEAILRRIDAAFKLLDIKEAPDGFTESVLREISELSVDAPPEREQFILNRWSALLGIKHLWSDASIGFNIVKKGMKFVKYLPTPELKLRTEGFGLSRIPVSVGIRW